MHILQNFAPSNLNRDDTGSPKDCEFGGYRRARISSQCLKRAIRTAMRDEQLLKPALLGARTKRLVEEISKRLVAQGKDQAVARSVVEGALQSVNLKVKEDGKTEYLLFLSQQEIEAIANVCNMHWESLTAVTANADQADGTPSATKSARSTKRDARAAAPPEVSTAMKAVLNGGKAVDLALFGRMLADLPDNNVEAASQVAHALSTNKVSMEFDFYTAVDDLKPEDTAGADMLGTVEFNSACFYRYLNVNTKELVGNLGGDKELADAALRAFMHAAIHAVPTGKQNSMAAQNPPSLVFVVARRSSLWSLANAFVDPVRADGGGDLVAKSTAKLDDYWGKLTRMYGTEGIIGTWLCALDGEKGLTHLAPMAVPEVGALISGVVSATTDEQEVAVV